MRYAIALAGGFLLAAAGSLAADRTCPLGRAPIFGEDFLSMPDCIAAHDLHAACALGTAGDAKLAAAVVSKCESGFAARLDAAQRRVYARRGTACRAAYGDAPESKRIFAGAMCQEALAAAYFKDSVAGTIARPPPWSGPPPAQP